MSDRSTAKPTEDEPTEDQSAKAREIREANEAMADAAHGRREAAPGEAGQHAGTIPGRLTAATAPKAKDED